MTGCGASWRSARSSGSRTWCDGASSSSSPCWRASRRELNPTAASGRPPLRRDPLVLLAGLVLVYATGAGLYLAGVPLHPAQQITAAAFVLLGVAAVALAPVNGLVLLYLLPPLFNGEDSRPYFFLLEILVSLTILAGFGARLWRRQPLVVPGGPFLALFCVSALLSMPGNLNEVWLELQVASWSQISEAIRRRDLHSNLYYIRTVLNVFSGAALCVLAASQRWTRAEIVRLAGAATLLYVGVTLVGLWVHWLALRPPGHLVTIGYGWDTEQRGFAGLGFNVSYFAQYALAYLPVAVLLLLESPLLWARGAAGLALVLTPYTIGQTGQRGAYIVYGLLQYTFLMRSMPVYFWITLGLVVALGPRRVPVGARLSRAGLWAMVAVLGVLAGLRGYAEIRGARQICDRRSCGRRPDG